MKSLKLISFNGNNMDKSVNLTVPFLGLTVKSEKRTEPIFWQFYFIIFERESNRIKNWPLSSFFKSENRKPHIS